MSRPPVPEIPAGRRPTSYDVAKLAGVSQSAVSRCFRLGASIAPATRERVEKAANKLGQITVIAFDEDPITLGAVREGSFAGTVVQQPFEWGYQGMKLMAKYLEGDKSGIPANKLIIVPTKVIDKSNVDQFEADLKKAIGK